MKYNRAMEEIMKYNRAMEEIMKYSCNERRSKSELQM